MTPAKNVRSLIEEAKDLFEEFQADGKVADFEAGLSKLTEALALLPDWQPFDPKREETWPKEMGFYICQMDDEPDMGGRIDIVYFAIRGPGSMSVESTGWGEPALHGWANKNVLAYQPLPPPYAKK